MKSKHRSVGLVAAALSFALAISACAGTDVVARVAKTSFEAVVEASGADASWDAGSGAWSLASAGGDLVLVAADFARNNAEGAPADLDRPDVALSLDAAPFLAAGLDPARLSGGSGFDYSVEAGRLVLRFELGDAKFPAGASASFTTAFAELLGARRDVLGYHAALDHYGLDLGGGNMFEWAKDATKNDKDLVWVLDPAALVAAGLDPAAVAGWVFAEVEVMDADGRKRLVEKLLRPYDLIR